MRTVTIQLIMALLGTWVFRAGAQEVGEKFFFDRNGKACDETAASYFRQKGDSALVYESFYLSNNKRQFEGRISKPSDDDESRNVYQGNCRWYHKNGNIKAQRNFDDKGRETGVSRWYYESGRLWKEVEYNGGKLANNYFIEYDEDGSRSRIFEEEFDDNTNDWDLYISEKSAADITGEFLEITALTREGTSRFISYPIESSDYTVEAVLHLQDIKDGERVGLLFGFKDWSNYNYVAIGRRYLYIGSVIEGVRQTQIDAMYCPAIKPQEANVLKVLCSGDKLFYSVNGELQFSGRKMRLFGSHVGFVLSGTTRLKVDRLVVKEMGLNEARQGLSPEDKGVRSTGSGFIFTTDGYVLTNQHVVDRADNFVIELMVNGNRTSVKAELLIEDKENDLAILKINDKQFQRLPDVNYAFKDNGQLDVGAQVFTIGYPHALTGMGKDAKFTDGRVSAKTGYNGALNAFQSTIPVQPGNSGGPVFNEKGQLVGVVNASFVNTDNVSYAIKLNYIRNLVELLPDKVNLPTSHQLEELPLEEKIKLLTPYVVLIKVK